MSEVSPVSRQMSPGNDSVLIKKWPPIGQQQRCNNVNFGKKQYMFLCYQKSINHCRPSLNTAKQLSAAFSRLKVSLLNQYLTLKEI